MAFERLRKLLPGKRPDKKPRPDEIERQTPPLPPWWKRPFPAVVEMLTSARNRIATTIGASGGQSAQAAPGPLAATEDDG